MTVATADEATRNHRILHIMDKVSVDRSKIHGPARQIAYRVPFYPPERFKVMLCNLRQEDAACDVLRASGVEVVSLNRGKFDPRAFLDIVSLTRRWKPTLIHLHGYGSHNFGRITGKLLRIPTIIQEHFVDHRLPAYQRAIDLLLHRFPKKGLAVSTAVKTHMARDRFMQENSIEVLGNGVPMSTTRRASAGEIADTRRMLGIPVDALVVGMVGRLAEMKGHRYFLDAVQRLKHVFPNLHVIIIGGGPELEGLVGRAKSLGLDNAVHFVGYQENVIPYLSAMDVSVVASIFNEGFNTVGVESLGVGVPLVITNLDCFHDLYFHDRNCLMVPPRDAEAMASAIRNILESPSLKERLVAGGHETVELYQMENISNRYIQIYDSLQMLIAPIGLAACL